MTINRKQYPNDPRTYIPAQTHGIHIIDHTIIIGVDLGQSNDFTVITVLEKCVKGYGILGKDRNGEIWYVLRNIERLPLGTDYHRVVERVAEIYNHPIIAGMDKAVVIDLTGLGRPVYDMMRQYGFEYSLNAIAITGGIEPTKKQGGIYHVPKRDLVSALGVALQNKQLRIAKGINESDNLRIEFANFQTKINQQGRDTYGGKGTVHDDIIMSLAMAVWLASQERFATGYDSFM
jgi:hypothetical protein